MIPFALLAITDLHKLIAVLVAVLVLAVVALVCVLVAPKMKDDNDCQIATSVVAALCLLGIIFGTMSALYEALK